MADERLLEAVREACPRGLWSKGISLARDRAVTRERGGADELVLRVAAPRAAIARTVILYPADGEWDCDCGARFDACEHVAAAVIALSQAQLEPGSATEVVYRLERASGRLTLRRAVLAPGGTEIELVTSLFSIASGRARDPSGDLRPTQADLEVDRLVGQNRGRTPITGALVPSLLAALAGCERVTLDGNPVAVSGDPVLPRGSLTDHGEGVRLAVVADPQVEEIVGERIALVHGVLHPLGHAEVAGERWELLPLVRDYAPPELGELVTQMLPALRRDIAIEVRSRRLPRATREARPRIHLEVTGDGDRLSVLATLVYGDPALARIDGDRMIQIRPPAPVRDRRAELELVNALRDRLNMVPGLRVTATGSEARALVERVRAFQRGDDPAKLTDALHEVELIPHLLVRDVDSAGGAGGAGGAAGPGGAASAVGAELDLWFETSEPVGGEVRRASGAAVLAAWQSGLDLLPLEGGGWAPLPADFLARHGQRVLSLLAARGEGGRVSAVALPALASLCDALGVPRPAAAGRLSALFDEDGRIPAAALPPGLTAELRPYQRVGVDWLCFLREAGLGAVLADDMGLGKTVQALAALDGRTIIVCPTSVIHNWAAELARFRPDLSVCLYHGPRRALDPSADVVVTSYALLRSDRDQLAEETWRAAILDEAQAIKNPDSQSAQAAFALRAHFRAALTGTPVENRLDELWSVCHFANPGLLGARADFQRRVAGPIAAGRTDAAAHLRDIIRPFVLRRLKREVAPELPPRTESVLPVELDTRERSIYDAVRAAAQADIVAQLTGGAGGEGGGLSVMAALEALLRLRQAACHAALLPGQWADSSSKIACLLEALDTAVSDGHKALVFSQWTSLLDLVEPHLIAANIAFTRLDGSTPDRAGVVQAFQDEAGPPVLLASLKAGGTGLNLTAADHVFILDPWWNPAAEDQAADRAHRIGQDRPVFIYRLVARDTVEERLLALQLRKRALADAALGQADRAAAITRDDLLALLE
ncbi:MAG TPA: DEAD/DEAH box helicase [Kofleriaceae bacterium]|nr:DEAD/DEAH box helicase [Kofleriaceae bacterium]